MFTLMQVDGEEQAVLRMWRLLSEPRRKRLLGLWETLVSEEMYDALDTSCNPVATPPRRACAGSRETPARGGNAAAGPAAPANKN